MSDQPKVWCPVCLVFHEHVTDAQLEQLRAERDEAIRLQETERQRADAYSYRMKLLDVELFEARDQLKATIEEADRRFQAAREAWDVLGVMPSHEQRLAAHQKLINAISGVTFHKPS